VTKHVSADSIGYVLYTFPKLSEAFILNELLALEAQGRWLWIASLRPALDEPRHPELSRLRAPIQYVSSSLTVKVRLPSLPMSAYLCGLWQALPWALRGRVTPRMWTQAVQVAQLAKHYSTRHLHAHFADRPATTAWLAASMARISFSFTAHANDLFAHRTQRERGVLAAKLRAAQFVTTVSQHNADYLQAILPTGGCPVQVLPMGVDTGFFAPPERRYAGVFTILAVGRLVEKKGLTYLIEACRLLIAEGHALRCLIAGDGPLRSALATQAASLGDRVTFLGPLTREQVRTEMQAASAFVLPSVIAADGDREGMPVVLLEAMASGLPVVASHTVGIPELIRDHSEGRLVPPGDAPALAHALKRLLLHPDEAEALGQRARQRSLAFDQTVTARRLLALFDGAGRTIPLDQSNTSGTASLSAPTIGESRH